MAMLLLGFSTNNGNLFFIGFPLLSVNKYFAHDSESMRPRYFHLRLLFQNLYLCLQEPRGCLTPRGKAVAWRVHSTKSFKKVEVDRACVQMSIYMSIWVWVKKIKTNPHLRNSNSRNWWMSQAWPRILSLITMRARNRPEEPSVLPFASPNSCILDSITRNIWWYHVSILTMKGVCILIHNYTLLYPIIHIKLSFTSLRQWISKRKTAFSRESISHSTGLLPAIINFCF